MRGFCLITGAVSALLASAPAAIADSAPRIFRVSADGPSRDQALHDATTLIARLCAASGYVIVGDAIHADDAHDFFYGPVTARCGGPADAAADPKPVQPTIALASPR